MNPTRVLIADDERLFAEALVVILGDDARIEVVGRAGTGREAIMLAGTLDPHVVVLDISMPGMDGFETIEALIAAEPSRRIVVLTGSADPSDMARAKDAGAFAYLTKDRIADDLVPHVLAASSA